LADITCIPTGEGWLYLAVILDCFTRNGVGWAMRDHMGAELAIAASTMRSNGAARRRVSSIIPNRRSQYAAGDYRGILTAAAIIQSVSHKANCWDNASMESFFGTLKPNSFTSVKTPIGMPRDATCSPISRATTIVSGSTPPSATSPPNRQMRYPHKPVSTLRGE
jgi:transposase InsO family protein